MGVTLERVQNKFACIIGELCSEPDILSQFAVWVDLRIAEYKAKGAISLDCTGMTPDPKWLKGLKTSNSSQQDPPFQKGPAMLSSRNTRHKNQVSRSAKSSESTLNPEWSTESQDADSIIVVTEEMSHDSVAFPVSLHSNHSNSTTTALRKRQASDIVDISHSDNSVFSPSHASKSRRLSPHSDNGLSAGGQESVSNQSFLSVIGVNDQPDQTSQDSLLPAGENTADLAESSGDITVTYNESPVFYQQATATDSAQTDPVTPPAVPKFTIRNTTNAAAMFERWLRESGRGENMPMHEIPVDILDGYMADFFSTIKKANGEDYQRKTLATLRSFLERHLRIHGYAFSLLKSPKFAQSQQAFQRRFHK